MKSTNSLIAVFLFAAMIIFYASMAAVNIFGLADIGAAIYGLVKSYITFNEVLKTAAILGMLYIAVWLSIMGNVLLNIFANDKNNYKYLGLSVALIVVTLVSSYFFVHKSIEFLKIVFNGGA